MLPEGEKGGALSTGAVPHTRRRLAMAAAAALLTLPALMLAVHGTALESAVAVAIADPASILAARSPGARASGALTQTKQRYVKVGVKRTPGPTERVLGQARTRPPGELPLGDAAGPPVFALLDIPQGAFGNVGDGLLPGGPGLVAFGGPPVTGIGVIGGGGGGNGGVGTTPITPVVPPVSAVPEPSTWLMTIMGFFTMGTGLRRRRLTGATAAGRHPVA
ncbi:PEP-CTERM sorting domain-containing protein [Sphingomonas sp. Leaf339]|uniref:PEP-CTERM sorting domain-containing protein n=1 Tax=Sphingomonas sp. Leaf339 TaxID=1736343 RepID=UPI0009EAE3FB|nr:PEP-CTERM sorting domain-containing protein [Sphingomonas sp. Leaf339]